MGLTKPEFGEAQPFADVQDENAPFILDGIRTVSVKNTEYGDGEMVLLRIRGHDKELSLWGSYLLAQAKSAEEADFGKQYVITRKVVEGFSKRPVKALVPAPTTDEETPF